LFLLGDQYRFSIEKFLLIALPLIGFPILVTILADVTNNSLRIPLWLGLLIAWYFALISVCIALAFNNVPCFEFLKPIVEPAKDGLIFARIIVHNSSKRKDIKNCKMKVLRAEPPIINSTNFILNITEKDYKEETVTIHADSNCSFDLCAFNKFALQLQGRYNLLDIVPQIYKQDQAGRVVYLPLPDYEFRVWIEVLGEDVPKETKGYVVKIANSILTCEELLKQ
jgi:hypothetical protein